MQLTELLVLTGGLGLGYWMLAAFLSTPKAGQPGAGPAVSEAPPYAGGEEPWHVVLGVAADASRKQVVAAWRRQIRECHPDKVATLDEATRRAAEARASRINAAYSRAPKRRG